MAATNTLFHGGSTTTTAATAHTAATYRNHFLPKKPHTHTPKPNTSPPPPPLSSSFKTRAAVGDGLMGRKSFYELLGIPEEGSYDDVKKAYKQMARIYHPDVCPPDQTEEYTRRFIEVQEAYETLSDPSAKALYDLHLARGVRFAFGARKKMHQCSYDGFVDEKSNWKNRWQNQMVGLKNRSFYKDSGSKLSWGARMRKQRDQSSNP